MLYSGESAEKLRKSAFARDVFGQDVVEHYAHHFSNEAADFNKSVTDWERYRYFEQI